MINQLIRRFHLTLPSSINRIKLSAFTLITNALVIVRNKKSFSDEISKAIEAAQTSQKNFKEKTKTESYRPRAINQQSENVGSEGNPEKRALTKRKKFCLVMGFSGKNYFGMQRNPIKETIEGELLLAMRKHKWITEEAFKEPRVIQFQRASRTDKGVSASTQCVSLELPVDLDLDLSAINKDLPTEIKIFDVQRVMQRFNPRKSCDARTYTYTLPTISFADHGQDLSMETYRLPNEKFDQLNDVLQMFQGTKNFHNFTSGKLFIDPKAIRCIVSFTCSRPFVDNTTNIEFAVIKVKGQSFMLHQIRKMIGLTLAIVRGLSDSQTLTQRAFSSQRIDVPKSPGLGLVLDQLHYDSYNKKCSNIKHQGLDWSNSEEEIQKFFHEHIFPTIVNTEMKEKSMVNWLETLPLHSYDIDDESTVDESPINKSAHNAVEVV